MSAREAALVIDTQLMLCRPPPEIVIMLSTFEFAAANSLFCINLVSATAAPSSTETPLSSFLSFSSYLIQNAYRSVRSSIYSCLCLLILQICLEDQTTAKMICGDEHKIPVRLCRQRTPLLPAVKGDRVPATVILDLVMSGLSHNLRIKLDVEFYE